MRDYLEFDTSPTDESCVQVSKDTDYFPAMRMEARRLIELLNNKFENVPEGCYFGTKRQEHDFGTYLMVCVFYDTDIEEECDFAYFVERYFPRTWDDIEVRDFNAYQAAVV